MTAALTLGGITFGPSDYQSDGMPRPADTYAVHLCAEVENGPTLDYDRGSKPARFVVDQVSASYHLVRSATGPLAWECTRLSAYGFHVRADGTYGGNPRAARGHQWWLLRPFLSVPPLVAAPAEFRHWAAMHNPGRYAAITFGARELDGAVLDPGDHYDHQEQQR